MPLTQLHLTLRSGADELDHSGALELAEGWIDRRAAELGPVCELTGCQRNRRKRQGSQEADIGLGPENLVQRPQELVLRMFGVAHMSALRNRCLIYNTHV